MKTIALALAMLTQTAAPAASTADDFCETVRALASGAGESTPFQTLRAQNTQFRFDRLSCFYTAAGGYRCAHNLARPDETRDSYATRVMACLPGSTRSTEQRHYRELITVRSGPLEARFDESGQDHGHVGRTVSIFFAAVR